MYLICHNSSWTTKNRSMTTNGSYVTGFKPPVFKNRYNCRSSAVVCILSRKSCIFWYVFYNSFFNPQGFVLIPYCHVIWKDVFWMQEKSVPACLLNKYFSKDWTGYNPESVAYILPPVPSISFVIPWRFFDKSDVPFLTYFCPFELTILKSCTQRLCNFFYPLLQKYNTISKTTSYSRLCWVFILIIKWWLYNFFKSSTVRAGWWTTAPFFPFARIFLNSEDKQLFAFEKYESLIIAMFETFSRKYLHIPWRISNNDFFFLQRSLFLILALLYESSSTLDISSFEYERISLFTARSYKNSFKMIMLKCEVFLWTSDFFLNVIGLLFPNWLIVCCCLAEEKNLIDIVLVFFFN